MEANREKYDIATSQRVRLESGEWSVVDRHFMPDMLDYNLAAKEVSVSLFTFAFIFRILIFRSTTSRMVSRYAPRSIQLSDLVAPKSPWPVQEK